LEDELMDSFLKRVSDIQAELKAPKSQYNSFGKYAYRSCEDILEAAKPICRKYNTVLNLSDEVHDMNGRWYVEAKATLYDTESDATLVSTASAREAEIKKGMDDSQITGTASSYARKYALNGLFNIDDTKDADTDEYHQKVTAEKAQLEKEAALAAEGAVLCSVCGKQITPKTLNGKLYTVNDIVAGGRKKFNKVMCWDCMTASKGESK
jgi:hypothetical protein